MLASHNHLMYNSRFERKRIVFIEEPIPDDDNCGFIALGISREHLSRSLLSLESDIDVRTKLRDEVYEAFISDHLPITMKWETYYCNLREKEGAMKKCLRNIKDEITGIPFCEGPVITEQMREKLIHWLETEGCSKQLQKLKIADTELNEANRKIREYCQSPEGYRIFCRGYLGNFRLGSRSATVYAAHQKINLFIFQKNEMSGELVLKEYHHTKNSSGKVYYLLRDQANHFSRLLKQS